MKDDPDLSSLEAQLAATDDPTARTELLIRLASAWALQDAQRAFQFAQQAVHTARSSGYVLGEASGFFEMGWASYNLGEYAQALESFQQALLLYQELRDPKGTADSLRGLGIVHDLLGTTKKLWDILWKTSRFIRVWRI
ncbi:tetratricopeptide repeat protein [Allomeiothermus silvanus]|uniref:tetratricopeptide repeat protein n=1 Tax=Allomeiothermus silvanus TaxID=52022 RepID=UPI0023EF75C7|nr:tetratricopeptide repeat protein [Allomeiothermus silvanus]